MAKYEVEVITGDMKGAGTWDHIFITLFGHQGQSERTEMDNFGRDFTTGATRTYTVETSSSLGKVLLVKLEKDPCSMSSEDEWYCSKIAVKTAEGEIITFPCYRWISRGELVELRGGKAVKVFEEEHSWLIDHRTKELTQRRSLYQWRIDEGQIHSIDADDPSELPAEVRRSDVREKELLSTRTRTGLELKMKSLLGSAERWESLDDIKKIFWCKSTPMSDYVTEHWKEDDFYGWQFLNGVNPTVIKRCSELPPNFPVTEEMVKPFLEGGSSLQKEMEKGNIFLCDKKIMDGILPRVYNGERLHLTPGLCLFYSNPKQQLVPIAIQLQQQPSEENPIFLPSDLETDWLLAKMFIQNADSIDHEAIHHLMNTHFLAEAFTIATLRCLPNIHPLYQLLFPHFRYTLHLNITGRKALLEPGGPLNISTLGTEGSKELMKRSLSELTYSSLCLPENITARGLDSIPNFYYRDDGLKLWDIISSFVRGIVEYYYPSDSEVCRDTELQEWICEIFTHGFLENKASGIPSDFHQVEEVIKFITMVIYTVTAQHAAVNNGQFDFYYWMPNRTLLLHKPPTTKGQSSMQTILDTLPNVGETVTIAAIAFLLSEQFSDRVLLGTYPEELFDETAPKRMINDFQAELSYLSEAIAARNSELEIPYTYLSPSNVENSIAI